MSNLFESPLFWLALSILAYEIGLLVHRWLRSPFANPLLIAAILICTFLIVGGYSADTYNIGGVYISMLLTPITVALALPIYRQLSVLRKNLLPILAGALVGSITSMGSVYLLSKLFGLPQNIMVSLLPKSVTTPIGISVSQMLGGLPSITVFSIVITGLFGGVVLPAFLGVLRINHPVAIGISMGTSAHAVGTARAIQLGETEGAMSGLAIGIAGLMTAIIASVVSMFV